MSEGHVSLEEMIEACGFVEEKSYDAPFTTFTWERWLQYQAQMVRNFTRFQRAITNKQAGLAMLIALDMFNVVAALQQEACAWADEKRTS